MSAALALRFALRELRSGLGGFRIFLICLALGVAAVAGVGTIGRSMIAAIGHEGQTILGGDISVSTVQRQLSGDEQAALARLGRVSTVGTLRAMARLADGSDQALVEIKAVDRAYPLVGQVRVEDDGDALARLAEDASGHPGLLMEAAAVQRLNLAVGDPVLIGTATFRLAAILKSEPDKAGGGISFGPRVMMRAADLAATGLSGPGALVTWRSRIVLEVPRDTDGLAALAKDLNSAFPTAGWEIRSRFDAAPGLKQNIERFVQFLTLVGFAALVVGGVGVANAVRTHLEARRPSIAALKCLGASGTFVVEVYLFQVLGIALLGVGLGLLAGILLPLAAGGLVARFIAVPLSLAPSPVALGLAAVLGLTIAATFALIPLGRAHDVPPTALFRATTEPLRGLPRRRYLVALALLLVALLGLTLATSADRMLTLTFLAGLAGVFALLFGVGYLVRLIARHLPRRGPVAWRMAIAALHRPGAATGSIVLSLGLGLTLVVALVEVDGNLRGQLDRQLPTVAPNFFFLDVKSPDLDPFLGLVTASAPGATLVHVPMLRGRIVRLKDVGSDDVKVAQSAAWVLNGDRGITYSDHVPANSKLVAGEWWAPDYAGPPLVSFEADLAEGLGLKLGDSVSVNVMGREIEAKIANTRKVNWESLGINFVMVFSPSTFRGAPHSHLVTLGLKEGGGVADEVRVLKDVTRSFPTVTSLRVKDALDAAGDLIRALTNGARLAAAAAVVSAVLVLAGALASGQARRVREAVILKVLGATRARLGLAFVIEYGLIGLVVALVGLAAGTAVAAYVVVGVMKLDFAFQPFAASLIIAGALIVTIGIGLGGTWKALARSSAGELRAL